MPLTLTTRPALLGISALLAALSWNTTAQVEEEIRWYQIEVAILTQPANAQLAASAEIFRKDVTLNYGNNTETLRSISDAYTERLRTETGTNLSGDNNTGEQDSELVPLDTIDEAEIAELLAHTPFVKLPEAMRGLNETIAAMVKRNRQRVLFHEAWRQPLSEPETAPAIIISGGDVFDKDQELSGTLSFGASRYLHVNTNLWFVEFASNFGQSDQEWPIIPTPPNEAASIIKDTEINLSAGLEQGSNADIWQQYETLAQDSAYQRDANRPYIVTSVATLQQNRRMRSGEVHYIDHPKIGILIFVTPYELPAATLENGAAVNDAALEPEPQ